MMELCTCLGCQLCLIVGCGERAVLMSIVRLVIDGVGRTELNSTLFRHHLAVPRRIRPVSKLPQLLDGRHLVLVETTDLHVVAFAFSDPVGAILLLVRVWNDT